MDLVRIFREFRLIVINIATFHFTAGALYLSDERASERAHACQTM